MSAIFSECRQYRYRLDRSIADSGPMIAFFGINPSTAAEVVNDSTSKKWLGFCKAWGARGYIAGNVFGFVSTEVSGLAAAADPVGVHNAEHQRQILQDADLVVPCWGNRGKVPKHLHGHISRLAIALRHSFKPLRVFGLTKSGDPMHPLMLGYDTPLMEWA